jgi:hypothetical protein
MLISRFSWIVPEDVVALVDVNVGKIPIKK